LKLFDIDDQSTWYEIYDSHVRNDPYWDVIEKAILSNKDDDFYKIMIELDDREEEVASSEILSLRQRCTEQFKKTYTHVTAYHACRTTNIDSYLNQGVIPSNPESIIEQAKTIFNHSTAVDEAIKDIGNTYLDHGRQKIGFFVSKTGSIDPGYNRYLKYGSELLSAIANRLGNGAFHKISTEGTPTLIKCALPISWICKHTTFPMIQSYAKIPLVQLLIQLRWPDKHGDSIRGAFLLTRSVPKEYILDTIDMTNAIQN